ncbi:MAG TPA: hypothetical protein VGF91_32330 [Solirubrobacteraceae bacterium]|jgi:hypothetical protein
MESGGPLQVTLTGDRSGDYVIVEERPDGSLVVAPDRSGRSSPGARRAAPRAGGSVTSGSGSLLSGLLTRPVRTPPSISETLEGWGVELADGETPSDFMLADIDGNAGFLAITSQRFIFVAQTGKGLGVVQENLLSAARNVEVVGRRRRQKLRVTWHGTENVISLHDRDALARLESHLTGHEIS